MAAVSMRMTRKNQPVLGVAPPATTLPDFNQPDLPDTLPPDAPKEEREVFEIALPAEPTRSVLYATDETFQEPDIGGGESRPAAKKVFEENIEPEDARKVETVFGEFTLDNLFSKQNILLVLMIGAVLLGFFIFLRS
jgi:hypothetical protein